MRTGVVLVLVLVLEVVFYVTPQLRYPPVVEVLVEFVLHVFVWVICTVDRV